MRPRVYDARMPKKEESADDYYRSEFRDFSQIKNAEFQRLYLEETEPGERPTDGRVLHVKKAEAIAYAMMTKLSLDVTINARRAWFFDTDRLHDKDHLMIGGIPDQPLAHGVRAR